MLKFARCVWDIKAYKHWIWPSTCYPAYAYRCLFQWQLHCCEYEHHTSICVTFVLSCMCTQAFCVVYVWCIVQYIASCHAVLMTIYIYSHTAATEAVSRLSAGSNHMHEVVQQLELELLVCVIFCEWPAETMRSAMSCKCSVLSVNVPSCAQRLSLSILASCHSHNSHPVLVVFCTYSSLSS